MVLSLLMECRRGKCLFPAGGLRYFMPFDCVLKLKVRGSVKVGHIVMPLVL